MVQWVPFPCWDNACDGGKGSLPFAVYVGNDNEKPKHPPNNVADGLELSPLDEPEPTASKSLTLCDRTTSSDAAATLPPWETVIATFPSSYWDGPARQMPGGITTSCDHGRLTVAVTLTTWLHFLATRTLPSTVSWNP